MKEFVHLHIHSHHSRLDGLGRVKEYVKKAQELNMPALAITDHGSTSGAYELIEECKGTNIKPILGSEFYISTNEGIGHLIVLAKSEEGWRNILRMQSYAYTKGFASKPCVNINILKQFKKDVIITSACRANPIGHLLQQGEDLKALEYATQFQDIFGEDFFIELQSSPVQIQHIINSGLSSIASKIGAGTIITTDAHYVNQRDAYAHEVLLAIQTKKKMSDVARFKFDCDEYYMKSHDEIMDLSKLNVSKRIAEESIANTLLIAEKCNVEIKKELYLPKFHTIPNGKTETQLLKEKTYNELPKRVENLSEEYIKDIEYELSVIDETGYSGYHLIVADFVNWAKSNNIIVGDGRGSGAGCKVGHAIGIHEINPDEQGLLFERFLSVGRSPDYLYSRTA